MQNFGVRRAMLGATTEAALVAPTDLGEFDGTGVAWLDAALDDRVVIKDNNDAENPTLEF
jgi:hypothetical protein